MGKGGIQRMKRSEHFSGNAPHAPITRTVLAQLVNEQRNLVDAFINLPIPVKGTLYATASLVVAVFNVTGATPFIYFRF
jgi:hypothetical protein